MELIPDPTSAPAGYDYLYAHGQDFQQHSDLSVMIYLWTYTWRKHDDRMDAVRGFVLSGKGAVAKIAKATRLSPRAVSLSLDRLRAGDWIETEERDPGNWRAGQDIWVRLDPEGHELRKSLCNSVP